MQEILDYVQKYDCKIKKYIVKDKIVIIGVPINSKFMKNHKLLGKYLCDNLSNKYADFKFSYAYM